jgi:uncharacterized membrane protein HdeD (DUF308 family)
MLELLASKWWAVGVRGLIAVLFGIVALVYPGMTLTVLVFLFGAYALVDGLFAIATAATGAGGSRFWFLFEGIIGIAAGIIAYAYPEITARALVYLIAAWAIFTGVFEIMAGLELPVSRDWLLALSGLASVVFGVLVFFYPNSGALAIVWVIGVYALVYGVTMVVLAVRLRSWGRASSSSPQTA